jgi:hypothetical protein
MPRHARIPVQGAFRQSLGPGILCAVVGMEKLIAARVRELAAGIEGASGAREAVLPAINALIELHLQAEAESLGSLPLFQAAVPHVLALLSNPDDGVRMQSLALIGQVKPDPEIVLPRLVDELARAHREQWRYECLFPKTLAAFGAAAEPAMPLLLQVMQSAIDHNAVMWCAQALAEVGPGALSALPAMEAARDGLTLQIGSADKTFKAAMNRAIRQLQRSARSPRPAPKGSAGATYLLDLVSRMAQPADGFHQQTRDGAWAEAKALSDAALLADLSALIASPPRLKTSQLPMAVDVLGYLTRNTDSGEGRRLILELLSRPGLPDRVLQAAIYAAVTNEMREAIPVIRPLLRSGNTYALHFAQELKLEECVPDVIEYMKTSPKKVLLGIFALQAIGSPAAIPVLTEYSSRAFTSRQAMERDWRFYATKALGTLR